MNTEISNWSPTVLSILLLTVAGMTAKPGNAAGLYFLGDAPIRYFTAEDHELFDAAAAEALERTADEDKVSWKNPASGARGVITPLETVDDPVYGLCRRVRVSTEAGGVRRTGVYKACKSTNDTWRLLSAGNAEA
jgi:surface antigen